MRTIDCQAFAASNDDLRTTPIEGNLRNISLLSQLESDNLEELCVGLRKAQVRVSRLDTLGTSNVLRSLESLDVEADAARDRGGCERRMG